MKDEYLSEFASKVFRTDRSVRFVALADGSGHVLGADYRKDVIKKLTDKQLEEYIRPWIIQIMIADKFSEATGELRYVLSVFQKILAATIQVGLSRQETIFVIVSFDLTGHAPADILSVIDDKILPLIGENKDYFV